MFVSRKAALSLLISLLLFAGFTILAFSGLLNRLEIRFYNPSVTRAITREINGDAKTIEEFLRELQIRFAATLKEGAVRRSFLTNHGSENINERSRLFGALQDSLGGLQYIRFIDSGGRMIHYSTYAPDILGQDRNYSVYRQYNETVGYIPYGQLEVPDGGGARLFLDESGERIIFSFPFYDSYDLYRGTAIFSLSVRAVMEQMVSEGRIKVGEDVSIISRPQGMVTGLPYTGKSVLVPLISSVWNDGILSISTLNSGSIETRLFLVSAKTSQGIFVGRLVNGSLLSFPPAMQIILLAVFFLTVYLIIFLLFNLRQDNLTIFHNRLKQLQVNLITEYYEHKEEADWSRWKKELELRREDVRSELKRGIKTNVAEAREIDALIDKSWDELVTVIGNRVEQKTGTTMDEEKLQALLSRLFRDMQDSAPKPPLYNPPETRKFVVQEEAEAAGEKEALENIKHESPPKLDFEEVSLDNFEITNSEEEIETLEEIFDEPAEGADFSAIKPQRVAEFQELDLSELDNDDGPSPGQDLDALASEIEFSPVPGELENENENENDGEEDSLIEDFEIVSPFSTILSDFPGEHALKEEQLELLDEEPVQEDTRETLAEEIGAYLVNPLFSQPFQTEMANEIEVLESPDDEDGDVEENLPDLEIPQESGENEDEFILERDGVNYINENLLSPDRKILEKLDRDFQDLIDSVLDKE
ncbi:hypothetical protein TREPR_0713 [Treponema primitia ZAS-2]|uniref:Uncharacterized protein n=1 Tax=Treponema primitia (strain ATCC BAA-887 / DSM 12427 / ZAS-2) TaxID=545694 RepID=F5YJX7_TREPZ|nr:hypothetical protein TREPR_0713 [Treponema primitia ZAS-2]